MVIAEGRDQSAGELIQVGELGGGATPSLRATGTGGPFCPSASARRKSPVCPSVSAMSEVSHEKKSGMRASFEYRANYTF